MKSVVCTRANPAVIGWARTALNIDVDRAAKRADVSEDVLLAFENGTQSPTLSQLRELAALYKRPVALFFLPVPPPSVKRPRDFRAKSEELSRETLLSIRRTRNVQEAIRLLGGAVGQPTYWASAKAPNADADAARQWLEVTDEEQLSAKDAADFFQLLAARTRHQGHSSPTTQLS